MRRKQFKYIIEPVIHILFWVGVYYVLEALTLSTYKRVVEHVGADTEVLDAVMRFPHPEIVLGFLMVLFYGSVFWLFKKAIRYKSVFWRVAVVTGWLVLLFAGNYLVIRALSRSTHNGHSLRADFVARVRVSAFRDSVLTSPITPGLHGSPFFGPRPDNGSPLIGPLSDSGVRVQLLIALLFISVLGVAVAYFFIKEWIRNDLTRSQVEARQLSTEIKFLRSQVNPHFLFNTLNNLFSMAQRKGNEELADGISKLSGMMRYMIHESNTDHVPLQREIEYLEDCMALSKLRYADGEVSVSFNVPARATIAAVQVAPMLFIPFLENAFKHGVSIGRSSDIALAISVDQKKLTFTCENTDHSAVKKLEAEKGGIGLENVKRRLELVYPGRHVLRTWTEDGKYKVNLQIDLL